MDSMAIYRGMDIGTAKPTPDERRQAPHHLIDQVEPHEDFSLAQYLDAAHAAAAEIRGRGRQVLFAGGTPLYLKGLLRGIFQGPPADWEFRRSIIAEAAVNGPDWLHAQLRSVDPRAAARLHSNDTRRLLRALEVFHLTGRAISELQQQFDRATPAEACRVFVLDRPKAELLDRIGRRVDAMFAEGLVDEVRRLLSTPCTQQDCPAGSWLWRGHRLSRRPARFDDGDWTCEVAFASTRQAAGDLVPQPERMSFCRSGT